MDLPGGLDSLIAILDRIHASEFVLCIEPALVPVLSAVTPYSTLKQHGALALVPLTPASSRVRQPGPAVVYITTATPAAVVLVAESAKAHAEPPIPLTVVFVPEIMPSARLLLTKHGVLGELELVEWPLGFVRDATQPRLLNLFCEPSAADPKAGVWPAVWALDALQAGPLGAAGRITAVGPRARAVASLLADRRVESAVKAQQEGAASFEHRFGYASGTFVGAHIEHLVVIDRDLDLVTPLLSQTTYEGVLDETVGITASGTIASGQTKVSLRDDALFASIAARGFASACTLIHDAALQLQQDYKGGIPSRDSSLAEIKSAVAKIGSLQTTQQLVDAHTELASAAMAALDTSVRRDLFDLQIQIMDNRITNTQAIARIQDLIFRMAPLAAVLRRLCLLCLVRGGIKESVLQSLLYGDILRTYGYQHLPALRYLKERGYLFSPKGSSFLLSTAPFTSIGSLALGANTANTANESGPADARGPRGGRGGADDAAANPLDISPSQIYSWYALNKAYKLYPHDAEADGASEPYAGYVPLTARIVQLALKTEPVAKTPLEPEFQEQALQSNDGSGTHEAKLQRTLIRNSKAGGRPIVVVAVIGGVTYAEAAAIERAAKQNSKRDFDVVVATTAVITGDKIVLPTQARK